MNPVNKILPSKVNSNLLHGLLFLLAAGVVLDKYKGKDDQDRLLADYYKTYGKEKIYRSNWTGKENT